MYIYIYVIIYVCPLFSLVHFSIHPMTHSFLDALEEARERVPPAVAGRLASSQRKPTSSAVVCKQLDIPMRAMVPDDPRNMEPLWHV